MEYIKLGQAEFIGMGPQSSPSAFNVVAQRVRKGSNSVVGWWLKHRPKDKPL